MPKLGKAGDCSMVGQQRGFSVAELLVVLSIIAIMAVVSVPYIVNYTRMYQSEVQATKVMDIMRETSQLALTRRRTYRMEIDVTDNQLKIIDENGSNPDLLVKSIPLESPGTLRLDAAPQSINRPDPPNYPLAVFAVDGTGHLASGQPVIGHRVWAIRFKSDGSVVNNGNTPISATLFIYPVTSPSSDVPTDRKQVRVVTIYGGSGAVRYWKFNGTSFAAS